MKSNRDIFDTTVVIPTCNRKDLLNRAVASVLNQNTLPVKIVVADNGDGGSISLNHEFITVVKVGTRIGPARARNEGAKLVRTKYLSFLDDDDTWENNYLSYIKKLVINSDCEIIVGQIYQIDIAKNIFPYKLFPQDRKSMRQVFFRNPGFGGSNITFLTNVFKNTGGYDETFLSSEDRDLGARVILAGKKICVQPNSIAFQNTHMGVRARDNEILGNILLLRKHYVNMNCREIFLALKTVLFKFTRNKKSKLLQEFRKLRTLVM